MSLDINGKILFENKSEPRFTFQMYNNPTRRNLKKEMINYKVKIDANRTHNNFNRSQSKLFEPTIRILPSNVMSKSNSSNQTIINDTKIKASEVVLTKRLKHQDNKTEIQTLNRKVSTIYKARSTLKGRLNHTHQDFYQKEFAPYLPLEKNYNSSLATSSYFFPGKRYEGECSDSLCSILNKKRSDYIDIISQNNPSIRLEDAYTDLLKTKKSFYKSNKRTYHFSKKFENDKNIPFIFPTPVSYNKEYSSNSEKERMLKNIELFTKLRYFLDNHPDMKKELVSEFFNQQLIYDKAYYEPAKLDNFIHYIKSDVISIDYRRPIQEIINEGVHFNVNTSEIGTSTMKTHNNTTKNNNNTTTSHNYRIDTKTKIKNGEIGNVDTFKYSTLVSNMNEQKKLFQSKSHPIIFNLKGKEEEIKELEREINKLNNVKLSNTNPVHRSIKRLYYEIKQREHDAHPQILPRRRKKLLEYIVLKNLKAQRAFENDIESKHLEVLK